MSAGRTYTTTVTCKCGLEYRHEGYAMTPEAQQLLTHWKRDHKCRPAPLVCEGPS